MAYAFNHDMWVDIVDNVNDVFNYTMALPVAKALAANIPNAKVASFPLPSDWPATAGDKRRLAFAWIKGIDETALARSSLIISASGKMLAGDWLDEEGCRLEFVSIQDAPQQLNPCQSILFDIVSRMPWNREVFDAAPLSWTCSEAEDLANTVRDILRNHRAYSTQEELSPLVAWESMANESRFSFARNAAILNEQTPCPSKSPRLPRRI